MGLIGNNEKEEEKLAEWFWGNSLSLTVDKIRELTSGRPDWFTHYCTSIEQLWRVQVSGCAHDGPLYWTPGGPRSIFASFRGWRQTATPHPPFSLHPQIPQIYRVTIESILISCLTICSERSCCALLLQPIGVSRSTIVTSSKSATSARHPALWMSLPFVRHCRRRLLFPLVDFLLTYYLANGTGASMLPPPESAKHVFTSPEAVWIFSTLLLPSNHLAYSEPLSSYHCFSIFPHTCTW